jgi:hypothetical protein
LASKAPIVKPSGRLQEARMSEGKDKPSREDRLAAKLRENLRRRKAQARAQTRIAPEGESALPKKGEES